jgi:hypothetical protein
MFRLGSDLDPEVFKNLTNLINLRSIQVNRYRHNSGLGRSQCFGIVKQRNGCYSGSRLNFERMDIYQELQIIGKKILPPDFQYTSIQINQNYTTSRHKDVGNRGESAIVGFGDYAGGELKIENTNVDIKYDLVSHTGERYSLVFHRPKPIFKEIPIYTIINTADKKLCLQEDIGEVRRHYDKNGLCIFAFDSIYPVRKARKYSLREAVRADV